MADGTMRLLDRATATVVRSVAIAVPDSGYETHVSIAAIVAAGTQVVIGSLEDMPDFGKTMRRLKVWDSLSENVHQLDAIFEFSPAPLLIAATSDRSFAATLSSGVIGTWRFDGGSLVPGPTLDRGKVTALGTTPAGEIVAANTAGELHLWDAVSDRSRLLGTNAPGVASLAVSPGGTQCLTASRDGVLRVYTLADAMPPATFHADSAITGCAWLDDDTLVAGEQFGRVHLLQVERR
jgi:WD40 repeat protein